MNTLQIEKVSKYYGDFVAVDQISFNVPKGMIFGLLGPNGAGKTSLIRIINSITMADEGRIQFGDEPLTMVHQKNVGYLPEERGLYKKMRVQDQLEYLAQLKGLSLSEAKIEIKKWFEVFGMEGWGQKNVEDLSKGMQQKVQFVSTVLHKPDLLILDEPFTGLDPVNTNLLKEEITKLSENGTTILFSTHRMEQVEEICEQIVLINRGKVILDGRISEIKQKYKDFLFEFSFEEGTEPDLDPEVSAAGSSPYSVVLRLSGLEEANQQMKSWMDQGVVITEFREILPSLNEIFIKLVTEKQVKYE